MKLIGASELEALEEKRKLATPEPWLYDSKEADREYIVAVNAETLGRLLETMRRMRECLEFYALSETWLHEAGRSTHDIIIKNDQNLAGNWDGPLLGGKRARQILQEMDDEK